MYLQREAHAEDMDADGDDTTLTAAHQQPAVDYMSRERHDNGNGERAHA